MTEYRSTPLTEDHYRDYFDCGVPSLDMWLDKNALVDHKLGRSRTHVWLDKSGCVVGYYTLLPTTISENTEDDGILSRLMRPRGLPRTDDIHGVLIGKLALDKQLQKKNLSFDLLADAFVNAYEAVQLIGGVVLLIDPMGNEPKLRSLYERFGFKSVQGSDRMFLNFNEKFDEGTPI